MITFTMTTCKRLDCFLRTMDSLDKLSDFHLVSRKILIDDCSTDSDRHRMEQVCGPDFEFVWRDEPGHDKSLRDLLSRIDSEYWLHWEDDRPMHHREPAISMSLDIFEHCPIISSVAFQNFRGGRKWEPGKEAKYCDTPKSICSTESGVRYNVPLFDSNILPPSFRLSPSLHKFEIIKAVFQSKGYPKAKPNRSHEYDFAMWLYKSGMLAAHLDHDVCYHISAKSAYQLNNTER